MKGGLFLDVVIRKSAAIFQLFACKNQPLLIRRNPFLVLDLRLDILDAVRWFHLKSDGLASQGFDKDLHSSTQTQNKMKGGLLLDVVIGESATILQLLAGENQPLLVGRDAFLVLNLCLDILDAVRGLHF